jgi:hypothetical protein
LGLENVDPNNQVFKTKKTRKHLKKNYRNKWHSDAEYFIDGRKVSQLEGESMNLK